MSITTTQPILTRSPFRQVLAEIFLAGVNLYALTILVYIGAQILDVQGVAELGSNFMPPALLAVFPLMLVSLLLRRRVQVILLLPIAAYFVVLYGALFLPGTASAASDAPRLRVLTYNLHGESDALEPIIDIIREANADIVALQELTAPAAERFAAEFGAAYPHQLTYVTGMSIVGQGVLSRYPLYNGDYWEVGLGNIRVEVAWEGEPITLYNLHPPPPSLRAGFNAAGRNRAIDILLDRLASDDGALILAGDFNMTIEAGDYSRLMRGAALWDAFRESGIGLGPTFPNMSFGGSIWAYIPPLFRIDYIFYRQPLRAVEARVWHTHGGSDHYPVLAALVME